MTWYDSKFPKPEMTEEEFQFLTASFTKDDVVIEYGSGHSTPNLAPLVGELWTVDHHEQWYNKVKDMCSDFTNVRHVHVPFDAPRRPPAAWRHNPESVYGFPTPFECVKSYSTWILTQEQKFDKVFLDGRGRQWVAQMIINNLKEDHELFVHDYIDRKRYFTVERFYDKIEVVGSMAKFKCKI